MKRMKWLIASPILTNKNPEPFRYIGELVQSDCHETEIYWRQQPYKNYTVRKEKYTPLHEWINCFKQAFSLLSSSGNDGIITLLVQLPTAIGLLKHLPLIKQKPVIALDFTIAHFRGGIYQILAQFALSKIEHFGVFCQKERELYSKYLGLPIERFEVLLQYAEESHLEWQENPDEPFIISLGSALRDYPTLFRAVERLNLPTIIASSRPALQGLEIPSNVKTPFEINRDDCWQLIQKARINVVTLQIREDTSCAGFRAITEALEIGCPLIATRGSGAEDYIIDGKTGLLVEPYSVESMAEAIERLWYNADLRQEMSQAAREYAKKNLSLKARGQDIEAILDSFYGTSKIDSNELLDSI